MSASCLLPNIKCIHITQCYTHLNSFSIFAGPVEPMFKRFQDWFLPLSRKAAAAVPPLQFPDPGVLVTWEWPADFTGSLDIGPYSLTTTLAQATMQWARTQLDANTFEREDYRELTECIFFYLGGDVSQQQEA